MVERARWLLIDPRVAPRHARAATHERDEGLVQVGRAEAAAAVHEEVVARLADQVVDRLGEGGGVCQRDRPVSDVIAYALLNLVCYRLHPNQVAIGFRLLARNLAIGAQIAAAQARPDVICEPPRSRASAQLAWSGGRS